MYGAGKGMADQVCWRAVARKLMLRRELKEVYSLVGDEEPK